MRQFLFLTLCLVLSEFVIGSVIPSDNNDDTKLDKIRALDAIKDLLEAKLFKEIQGDGATDDKVMAENFQRILGEIALSKAEDAMRNFKQDEEVVENVYNNNPESLGQIATILEHVLTGSINFTRVQEHTANLVPQQLRNQIDNLIKLFGGRSGSNSTSTAKPRVTFEVVAKKHGNVTELLIQGNGRQEDEDEVVEVVEVYNNNAQAAGQLATVLEAILTGSFNVTGVQEQAAALVPPVIIDNFSKLFGTSNQVNNSVPSSTATPSKVVEIITFEAVNKKKGTDGNQTEDIKILELLTGKEKFNLTDFTLRKLPKQYKGLEGALRLLDGIGISYYDVAKLLA